MRPKPLIPTRTVTTSSSMAALAVGRSADGGSRTALSCPRPYRAVRVAPPGSKVPSGLEHLRCEVGLRAGDPEVGGPLVGHGQQATDAPGDGVLRQRRVGELAELLEA